MFTLWQYDAKIFSYATEAAAASAGIPPPLVVVDVNQGFTDLGNPGSLYANDYLHLSSAGYAYWDAWAKAALGAEGGADANCVRWLSGSCAPVPAPVPAPVSAPVPAPTSGLTFSASTCDDLGWGNAETRGDSMVCGESDLNLGGCSNEQTWDRAVDFCQAAGARLCTLEELQKDEARGTGCGYDTTAVWSSTSCGSGSCLQAPGSTRSAGTECSPNLTGVLVRCCADVEIPGGGGETPVASPVAAPVASPVASPVAGPGISASSCDKLGWGNAASYGDSMICGESDLGLGGCSGDVSWAGAVFFCESIGARLCTEAELSDDEARATGCGYDRSLSWTSTACDGEIESYIIAPASTKTTGAGCFTTASTVSIARCCADVF